MKIIILCIIGFLLRAGAQTYSASWCKIAGGGGTSTNGSYQVSGTIGQHDASGEMTGGNYSLTGGFWSLISVVQTAGAPSLNSVVNGSNHMQVLWPAAGGYTLQQNSNLATTNWSASGYSVTSFDGTNSISITNPVGQLFFRLKQ
jgi:hypothetical protein